MKKYLFCIHLRSGKLNPNYNSINLHEASLELASQYQAQKCYDDVKNDYRVDYVLYHYNPYPKNINILDSRYDKTKDDYIVINFQDDYFSNKGINSNNKNWVQFYELLKPFYKRYTNVINFNDLFDTDKYLNKNLFCKHYNKLNNKSGKLPPFYWYGDKNKLVEDIGYFIIRYDDASIFISDIDPIFESNKEYRVILVNEKLHSIQNYKDESKWDDGNDLIKDFTNEVTNVLKSSGLIKNNIFSFDIVTNNKECKLVEFHHNTDNLGHYHKTNQNNYKRYIDLLLEK